MHAPFFLFIQGVFGFSLKILFCMLPSSVRYNLDPFNHHSDDEVWEALERVRLASMVKGIEGGLGLGSPISSGGSNLSAG